jgi:hypothetical protein
VRGGRASGDAQDVTGQGIRVQVLKPGRLAADSDGG